MPPIRKRVKPSPRHAYVQLGRGLGEVQQLGSEIFALRTSSQPAHQSKLNRDLVDRVVRKTNSDVFAAVVEVSQRVRDATRIDGVVVNVRGGVSPRSTAEKSGANQRPRTWWNVDMNGSSNKAGVPVLGIGDIALLRHHRIVTDSHKSIRDAVLTLTAPGDGYHAAAGTC